jgi:hypothetical protein
MKHTENSGIIKWVIRHCVGVVGGQHHDVGVRPWVHGVLSAVDIVGGIIDAKNLVPIDPVIDNEQAIPFGGGELLAVARPSGMEQTAKKMLLELRPKVLPEK